MASAGLPGLALAGHTACAQREQEKLSGGSQAAENIPDWLWEKGKEL